MVKQLFRTTSICVESLELLIDKLDGELKSFVAIIENAKRFGAEVKQLHEKGHHLPKK
ncbi:11275_t:CDS:2, partial [Rhizophagus irregularis]